MINVTIGESKPQSENKFPKLMKNQYGEIFFMIRPKYGLPITGNDWVYDMVDFADFSRSEFVFTDYNKPITLQNA